MGFQNLKSFLQNKFNQARDGLIALDKRAICVYGLLALIVFIAASVRILRSKKGLPYVHYYDEPRIAGTALHMLKTGDYNPHYFIYGSLTMYLNLAVDVVHYFYLMGQPEGATPFLGSLEDIKTYHDTGWDWTISHPSFYLWNRWLMAAMGTASVVITYFLAREVGGHWAGILAAVLLAGLGLHIHHSASVLPNVPFSFFVLGVVLLSVLFLKGEKPVYLLGALGACGLATATKYNAALSIVVPLLALLYSAFSRSSGYRWWLWVALPLVPALAFFIGAPYAFLDLPTFLNHTGFVLRHYRIRGHENLTVEPGMTHLFLQGRAIVEDMGLWASILSVLGLAFLVSRRLGWVLVIFPAVYLTFMSRTRILYTTNLVVIQPFAAVAFGCGAVLLYKFSIRIASEKKVLRRVLVIALVLVMGGFSAQWLASVIGENWRYGTTPETRTQAIYKVNSLIESIGSQQIKVGIAEELRLHDADLMKLTAPYTISPYLDLICNSHDYDIIIGPIRCTSHDGKGKEKAQLLNRLLYEAVPENISVKETIDSNKALSLDVLSVDPGVLILTPPEAPAAQPAACGHKIPFDRMLLSREGLVEKDVLQLHEGGTVTTPAFHAIPGLYLFSWQARGSVAGGGHSQLKAILLEYAEDGKATPREEEIMELTSERASYALQFELPDSADVALKLEVTDECHLPGPGEDRNVFLESVRLTRTSDGIPFELMLISPGFVVENEVLAMRQEGAVTTPAFRTSPGSYLFRWRARGSMAGGEYSKLKATLLEYTEGGRTIPREEEIMELTSETESYALRFEMADSAAVALRLEFINDRHLPELGEDRNVFLESIGLERMSDSIPFESMLMNREFPVEHGSLGMYWAGAITTPAFHTSPGSYLFRWRARGSVAGGEHSKLKATLLEYKYMWYWYGEVIPRAEEVLELTSEVESYELRFEIADETDVALRLEFINDLQLPESGEDRNVWLEPVSLVKMP